MANDKDIHVDKEVDNPHATKRNNLLASSSAMDFDSIIPARYISFTLPIPNNPTLKSYIRTERLRIAILDSHSYRPTYDPPAVGAMLVPRYREHDWTFSTEAGIIQLLSCSPEISRLILVGNDPSESGQTIIYTKPVGDNLDCIKKVEDCFYPLLVSFLPKRNLELKRDEISFMRFDDNVVTSVVLEGLIGPVVGEMLVEDVELGGPEKEFRRKLRFKRTPNLVQSEIKIVPMATSSDPLSLGDVKFLPDLSVLVHIYLAPMAASLSLVSAHLQNRIDSNIKPRALCIGVGGGTLVGFLATQLGFDVLGLDVDRVVLNVAMEYFGLKECGGSVRVSVADGIDFLKICSANGIGSDFDAVMVDLDPGDLRRDTSVPPLEFMQKTVLSAAKSCLSDAGLLVLNVIPKDKVAYKDLKRRLKKVFVELYQIDLGKEEHLVVIATKTRVDLSTGVCEDAFLTKLRSVVSSTLTDSIQKI